MHGGRRQRCHRWVPFEVIPCCERGKPPCSTFVASANLSLKLIIGVIFVIVQVIFVNVGVIFVIVRVLGSI